MRKKSVNDPASYVTRQAPSASLRLPREGWLDLTYRCNNSCLHCWVLAPDSADVRSRELSFAQICEVVDEAHRHGCREWYISGGEPMLRPDFAELFDYVTARATLYSLNTNGTLITPQIARLLRRKGVKMVALYGADATTHDAVTRNHGSFDQCLQGMAYLREAGAGFMVQIIPMQRNVHQLAAMTELAKSQSPLYRIGVSWLHGAASGDEEVNRRIKAQRLSAREVVALDPQRPELQSYLPQTKALPVSRNGQSHLAACAKCSSKFHLDPYGTVGFCSLMKKSEQRVSILEHSFADIWFTQLTSRAVADQQAVSPCDHCDIRRHCHTCPAYAYLETGSLTEPAPYLCELARERKRHVEQWRKDNYARFTLAGMTIHLDSDLPLRPDMFGPALDPFRTSAEGEDHLYISHRLGLPDLASLTAAELVYKASPWAIYRKGSSWVYLVLEGASEPLEAKAAAVFADDYSRVIIYHGDDFHLQQATNMRTLTMFPSDQIMISQVLARREGCYLHSAGMVINGKGLLFLGPSGTGKSTTVKMLGEYGEVLCDDRNILRRWPDGYWLHGTWSHGEVPQVANLSAPLSAIIFLEQAADDQLLVNTDPGYTTRNLLNRIIKPHCDEAWWQATLTLVADVASAVPTYRLLFTRNKEGVKESLVPLLGPLKEVTR